MMYTTINGNEIKLFDRQELGKVFTQKVNEYLIKGFIFNIDENSRGTQGEELKVFLTNDGGNTVYAVFFDKVYGGICSADAMVLYVKKYENAKGELTLWLNRGEEIEKKVFYAIERMCCRRGEERWVESLGDYEIIKAIQDERFDLNRSHNRDVVLPEKYKKIALKLLQKKKGHKSRKIKDIERVVKRNHDGTRCSYAIIMNGVGSVTIF